MAESAVVVAEYHAVRRHASAALTCAGFRVMGASALDAAYGMARLYRARLVVLQASGTETARLTQAVADLRADPATASARLVVLGPNGAWLEGVSWAGVLDGPALLRAAGQAAG